MNVSIEDKKAEAVARMKLLGIYPETIDQFEREGLVSISEPPFGAFFWVDDEDKKRIQGLPTSLGEALDALEADHEYLTRGGVFPEELIQNWLKLKRAEAEEGPP